MGILTLVRELADIILICEERSFATVFPSMECSSLLFSSLL